MLVYFILFNCEKIYENLAILPDYLLNGPVIPHKESFYLQVSKQDYQIFLLNTHCKESKTEVKLSRANYQKGLNNSQNEIANKNLCHLEYIYFLI